MNGQTPLRPPLKPPEDGEPVFVDLKKPLPPGVRLTRTGLEVERSLSIEECQDLVLTLDKIGKSVQWWIGDAIRYAEAAYGERFTQWMLLTGFEKQTLKNWRWVANKFPPEVRNDDLSYTHHAFTAGLKRDDAVAILEQARANKWTVSKTRAATMALRTEQKFGKVSRQAFPDDVYSVLLMDPPYRYKDGSVPPEDSPNSRYSTMAFADLAALPVERLAAKDAVLFLWAPSAKLPEAISLMQSWGFEYKTCAVWIKDRIGLGTWLRSRHEHLLIGRKGTAFPPPKESDRPDSVFFSPREEHSKKPDCVYSMIERMCPDQRYLELFARQYRAGWDGWGDQYTADKAS